ncbi:uncharacterized protein B0T15DRAFT_136264 [Chaetomium strumarium]|uniref:Uncharacterized protein n=1 Tax=Chaetomium strumarium TaxID=1170767 RepID=A0AAJ0GUA7_9PEZI|nr:hypothetical protein B0T15DRAFT_136264 [Chaetomium strumarium]
MLGSLMTTCQRGIVSAPSAFAPCSRRRRPKGARAFPRNMPTQNTRTRFLGCAHPSMIGRSRRKTSRASLSTCSSGIGSIGSLDISSPWAGEAERAEWSPDPVASICRQYFRAEEAARRQEFLNSHAADMAMTLTAGLRVRRLPEPVVESLSDTASEAGEGRAGPSSAAKAADAAMQANPERPVDVPATAKITTRNPLGFYLPREFRWTYHMG